MAHGGHCIDRNSRNCRPCHLHTNASRSEVVTYSKQKVSRIPYTTAILPAPSEELLYTMFVEQPVLKRQSAHVPMTATGIHRGGRERPRADIRGICKGSHQGNQDSSFSTSVHRQAIIDSIDADSEGTIIVPLG